MASGVDGGHTLSYQALETKGVTLLGKFAGRVDSGRDRGVPGLSDPLAARG
jgi:hypothetical protein